MSDTLTRAPEKTEVNLPDAVAWDNDHLVILDHAITEQVERKALSPSTSKSMASCRARWLADRLLPDNDDRFAPAPLGTSGHLILERFYDLPPSERTSDRLMLLLLENADEEYPVIDEDGNPIALDPATVAEKQRWIGAVYDKIQRIFEMEAPQSVNVRQTEMPIDEVEIAGVPFNGHIDRVDDVFDENGNYIGVKVIDYKGLALDTPLPTPTGWTTMGQVRVGDLLIGADGQPTKVTEKSGLHNRPCYRVTMSDGTEVICDNVHLWNVDVKGSNGKWVTHTVDADTLYAMVTEAKAKGFTRLRIGNVKPVDFTATDSDLTVDPWLLGAWLGDGRKNAGEITVGHADQIDMLTLIKEHWHGSVNIRQESEGSVQVALRPQNVDQCPRGHNEFFTPERGDSRRCKTCEYNDRNGGRDIEPTINMSFARLLSELGVMGNKYVPAEYLRASKTQRLALLQGLMDTDGSWNPKRQRAVFVNTNRALADAVAELARSLGVTVQWFEKDYENAVRPDATVFMVEFRPIGFNPFRLPRKAIAVDEFHSTVEVGSFATARATARYINTVEPVASVTTQCVAVDAPDRLYLCSTGYLPTHNTGNPPKSLKFGDDHGDQMRLYKLAYEAKYGVTVVEATLYYTAVGKVRSVPISKAALNKTLKAFVASWKAHNDSIAQEAFITKPTPLCGWCPLVNSCPSAIKDDGTKYVPKVEGIPTFEELPVRHLSAIEAENAPVPDAPAGVEFEFDDLRMLAQATAITPPSGEHHGDVRPTPVTEPVIYPTITGREPVEYGSPETFADETPAPAGYAVAQPVAVIETPTAEALTPVAETPVEMAARTTRRGVKTLKENNLMTQMFAPELDKPWDPRNPHSLPPNAPDATALFGLVNMASEIIADNQYPLDKVTLRAMSGILAKIIADAELAISGRIDWTSGLNTRLRGSLHSFIDKNPMPVGTGDDGALIEKWMSEATESIVLVANTVVAMFTRGLGEQGALAFTNSAGAKTFAQAPQAKTDEPPF